MYNKINQNFKKTYIIYSQFENLIFKFLSKIKKKSFENKIIFKIKIIFIILFIIENYNDAKFCLFINNYINATTNFDIIFEFLYIKYFFKTTFKSIYLSKYKIYIFINNLKIIKFIEKVQRLYLLIKYRKKNLI